MGVASGAQLGEQIFPSRKNKRQSAFARSLARTLILRISVRVSKCVQRPAPFILEKIAVWRRPLTRNYNENTRDIYIHWLQRVRERNKKIDNNDAK